MQDNSVLITGIGLISSQGEGAEAHWRAVSDGNHPNLDTEHFAPYTVHKLGETDWKLQIPSKSDRRQMGTWQMLGTYAAGLALDDAGIKGNEELTSTMDMIVAAGGGERDIDVDAQILQKSRACKSEEERGILLNQMLQTELRPTLFLAQLSNLLAGNISIVHKVIGSSRTFMGEEGCGLAALETAFARIQSGQSTHILVGASYNAEHYDVLLGQELNSYLKPDGYAPVWARQKAAEKDSDTSGCRGLITGSSSVFLVLENADHAKLRGARAYAKIDSVITDQIDRRNKSLSQALFAMLAEAKEKHSDTDFVVSGASGAYGATGEEEKALKSGKFIYRAFSSLFGHMREAQFPFAVALAALAVRKGQIFAPFEEAEPEGNKHIASAFAVTAGIDRAEGIAHLSQAN